MAKYRITSIPPSLPKAQDGGEKKKGQFKNKLRNFFYGDGTQPKLAMDLFNTDFFNEDPAAVQSQPVRKPGDYPMVPVDGQEQFDIFQPRTEQERANTLPTIWTQGTTIPAYTKEYQTKDSYLYNPITWGSYQKSLEKKLGLDYTGPGGKIVTRSLDVPEQFIPDYSLGEDGQPLQCPEGKYPYKGQCFSEEMYLKLQQEEMDNEQYAFDREREEKQKKFQDDIMQIRQNSLEQQQRFRQQYTKDYLERFKNSKKSDKIEPYETVQSYEFNLDEKIPIRDAEGNQIINKKTGQPEYQTKRDELQQAFLVIEDKKSGAIKLYPKEIVYDRIINNGFQAEQFKNIWGIDPKQVKSQVGDIMNAAAQQYDATMKQKILQRAMDQGKSIEEVVAGLSPKLATKEGAKGFIAPTQKLVDDAIAEIRQSIKDAPGIDNSNVLFDDDIIRSNDPMGEWERKYHPNMLTDKYYTDKQKKGQKAYTDWMTKYGKTGQYEGQTFAKDDRMANQRVQNQLNMQTLNRNYAEGMKEGAESEDFNKAFGEYLAPTQQFFTKDVMSKALENLDSKEKLKFLSEYQKDANVALENLLGKKVKYSDGTFGDMTYGEEIAEGIDRSLYGIRNQTIAKQGDPNLYNIDEDNFAKVKDVLKHPFDAIYYGMNEREGMWDGPKNLSYSDRKRIEKEKGIDLGTMPTNVMSAFNFTLQPLNPFKIGFNLREGYDQGDFLGAVGREAWDVGSTLGMIKGLNAMKGVTNLRPLISNTLNNPLTNFSALASAPGLAQNAYENFQAGNYGQGTLNASLAALSAIPAYKGIKSLGALNSLRNPNTVIANINPATRYAFSYNAATPGSGLIVGNPSALIPGVGQPKFQSILNPLNRFSRGLGFGEFNINQVNPGWRSPGLNRTLLGPGPSYKFKNGGSLPKYQTAGIVKGLKALGKYADDIAEGGNFLKYAWKSPAIRFDPNVLDAAMTGIGKIAMPQSQALFDQIQDLTASDHMRDILLKDYEISSYPYTGRFGSVDPMRAGLFDQLTDVAKIQTDMPLVMSRRINLENPKLYSLESGIYNPERPLSFSAGRDQIGNKQYSGAADRLVLKLKPGQYNILKNMYPNLTDDQIAAYGELLNSTGRYLNDAVIGNMNMAKFNRSGERELITPRSISFGEFGRVKNNFGGIDVLAEPIGLESKQPTWVLPTREDLAREFAVEHQRKGLGFFNSEDDFMNAVNLGTVKDVTTDLDRTIGNRSFTSDRAGLRNLISGYGSWPKYRNDETLQRLYTGLNQGAEMPIPIVIQYNNGLNNRILSGNTRLDASRHLGLTPQALFINATNYRKGGQPKAQMGGIATQLTQDEIDQYVAGGYIIEDE